MKPEVKYKLIEKLIQTEDDAILNQVQEILEGTELSDVHKRILDKRLEAHKARPESGESWAKVKESIKKKL